MVVAQVQEAAERDQDAVERALDAGVEQVPGADLDPSEDAGPLRVGAQVPPHGVRRVDRDHVVAGLGEGNGDPARAGRQLDDRRLGALRHPDVVGDVLDNLEAPRVVDVGDRCVLVDPVGHG